jgi:hypothetical protein
MIRRFVYALALTALISQLQACGCDDEGCNDAIVVRVGPELANAEGAELLVDGSVVQRCTSDNGDCQIERSKEFTDFVFVGVAPERAEVRLLDASGRELAAQSVTPEYESHSPNGEDCPPRCETATVQL